MTKCVSIWLTPQPCPWSVLLRSGLRPALPLESVVTIWLAPILPLQSVVTIWLAPSLALPKYCYDLACVQPCPWRVWLQSGLLPALPLDSVFKIWLVSSLALAEYCYDLACIMTAIGNPIISRPPAFNRVPVAQWENGSKITI